MTEIEKLLEVARTRKRENRQLDFKGKFDPSSASEWCEVIKDVIAMANSGGGTILFGIKDNGAHSSFNKRIVLDIDPAVFADKIRTYTGENFAEFEILEIKRGKRDVGAFVIAKASTPIAFTKNGADITLGGKQKPAFIKGSVYFRHGAKSEPGDTTDIKRAIDRVVEQVRKKWFRGVRQMSQAGVNEEIEMNIRSMKSSLAKGVESTNSLKISERGKPVRLTNAQIDKLKQQYPLSYNEVKELCKKKRPVKQLELQKYINRCKENQSLSINWKQVSKSLNIPSHVAERYTYSHEVVNRF
ncbi:hypothetical protein A2765_02130 [Candidatus Kaiserbacteria bacterium RIFCSPHIGHO2_01_FULL_56_24]|uniref:Schlafen AlbA-2 domain-containing protein n=1 Tax=Candidatus Kaiserbacteria bacterium RIFCSPHIGHO2_01_FULL_56_24 TaxID=1798487 RepID=A0A1F6DAS3_9BACT|nr:MAG: hypothetical protein A2765_02130 [Candidatus Kaiserbacteria bacterium RIFCSPHIGHO2_01_FULL_56_24]